MTPDEYERVVAKIAETICVSCTDLSGLVIGAGRKNRIAGASGYRHQIDISLSENNRLFIIECKRWHDRVGVQAILVLAARAQDIGDRHPKPSVTAILVSTQGASENARKIAKQFHIAVEIVKSPEEFGLRIGRFVRQGMSFEASPSLSPKETVVRNGVVVDES